MEQVKVRGRGLFWSTIQGFPWRNAETAKELEWIVGAADKDRNTHLPSRKQKLYDVNQLDWW